MSQFQVWSIKGNPFNMIFMRKSSGSLNLSKSHHGMAPIFAKGKRTNKSNPGFQDWELGRSLTIMVDANVDLTLLGTKMSFFNFYQNVLFASDS